MVEYRATFYDYTSAGSEHSAASIVALLGPELSIRSVVDFGCAEGVWLSAWRAAGVSNIHGVDGPWVNTDRLKIAREEFTPADLAQPISLQRTFDLVQCLEAAEHLAPDAGPTLVATLVRHGTLVLFSAAPPGQGGENHTNERPYEYWRALFAERGFIPLDFVRPRLASNRAVQPWYRYNILLFAHRDRVEQLPAPVRATALGAADAITDVAPRWYRVRRALVGLLPPAAMNVVARMKARASTR